MDAIGMRYNEEKDIFERCPHNRYVLKEGVKVCRDCGQTGRP